jgi:DNA invertase Pin-like site-specific DNA recombinase
MSSVEYGLPSAVGQSKITATHLQRLACIYIRQSSLKQVMQNQESQLIQRDLVKQALSLGWSRERIQVVDSDQGLSGEESSHRQGFRDLVAAVSLGHVGIIFGYQASRLARNNSDWYHLLDLAAVFGTLIADCDGIYDPKLFNDRLLLGLKGTMSEAELHIMRQRLEAGRLNQVRRGEYRQHLPTGLVRLDDGTVIKDPDDQIRHTIELVLQKFAELGSCQKVLRYFHQHNIFLPRRQSAGYQAGELLWKPAMDAAIYDIIRNPAYAGAFAYGRRQTDPTRRSPGRRGTGVIHRLMSEWIHLQHNVYPAYITWEQYLANQEQLRQNAAHFKEEKVDKACGAAREGAALLQGLVVCGECSYHMSVAYKSSQCYFCTALRKRTGQGHCACIHGPTIDEVVVQAFFEAIQPAQLDALSAIVAQQQAEQKQLLRQRTEQLERARYEARLAERQYKAVDPDNRLVAASLENQWEEKLLQLQETQEAYERFEQANEPATIPPELVEQFRHISDTLPTLWHSGCLSNVQKKELLRSLIAQVILKRIAPDTVSVKIVWVSGHYSVVLAHPPITRLSDVSGYEEMVSQVEVLWQQGQTDQAIAEELTNQGFRGARAKHVSAATVQKIRLAHAWFLPLHQSRGQTEIDGYLTVRGLAAELVCPRGWVHRRIWRGEINPRYIKRHPENGFYLIENDPDLVEQLRQQRAQLSVSNNH